MMMLKMIIIEHQYAAMHMACAELDSFICVWATEIVSLILWTQKQLQKLSSSLRIKYIVYIYVDALDIQSDMLVGWLFIGHLGMSKMVTLQHHIYCNERERKREREKIKMYRSSLLIPIELKCCYRKDSNFRFDFNLKWNGIGHKPMKKKKSTTHGQIYLSRTTTAGGRLLPYIRWCKEKNAHSAVCNNNNEKKVPKMTKKISRILDD